MNKRICLTICLLSIASISFSIDLKYINVNSIENRSNYKQELMFIWDNQKYLQSFYPDEYWKAEQNRAYYTEYLKNFYKKLSIYPEEGNQEYLLLKAMVAEYLYHLDSTEYFDIAVKDYNSIENLKERDYRYKWFLGKFYTKAAKPYEGIAQYKYVLQRIPEESIYPDFFLDYAYSLGLAMMPESALYYYEKYLQVTKRSEKIELFEDLKDKMIIDPSIKNLDFENLFYPFKREEGSGLLSKYLGLWLPLRPEWKMQKTGLKDGISIIKIESGEISHEPGNSITYSVLIESILDDKEGLEKLKESLPSLVKSDLGLDPKFIVYEYSDETVYKSLGGSHGFLVEVTVPYSKESGMKLERPSKVASTGEKKGASYMPFQRQYLRYPGTITHYLLLDTCNYIFEESKEQFITFLKNGLFE